MIVVDYSQTVISAVYAETQGSVKVELDEDIIRHITLNTLRSHYMKYKRTHGEMVIAVDSTNYWRKDIHPNYKGTRKVKREDSPIDWKQLYEIMGKIKVEIDVALPFKVIEVERVEADDIIASLAIWSSMQTDETSLFDEPQPFKIISSDGDFPQLQKMKHVSQFNQQMNREMKPVVNAAVDLNLKCIIGDTGDAIPNIKSGLDDLVNKVRQKPIKQTEKDEWSRNPSSIPDQFIERYKQNKSLIDLTMIPKNYQDAIIDKYKSKTVPDETLMYEYFKSKGLTKMLQNIGDFK